MKVRHIRRKPWLRKGLRHRAGKRQMRSIRRRAAWAAKLLEEACRSYMRPVFVRSPEATG